MLRRRSGLGRLGHLLLALLCMGALVIPTAGAEPPFRLPDYVTDRAGVLNPAQLTSVTGAVNGLYTSQGIRLWVVLVDDFSGRDPDVWSRSTLRASNVQSADAILAVATSDREYSFQVPTETAPDVDVDAVRRQRIEPLLRDGDWAGAAVAAADGLHAPPPAPVPWVGVIVVLVLIVLAVAALLLWQRHRRRARRRAELAAARRLDATDPATLAPLSIEALDDLSRSMVVDVDNALRTSDNELSLAVEEFGERDTARFTTAVAQAKATLTQAFNVRQILDDAVPESPQERRDLLTRVVVAAAKADRELDTQRDAFHELRNLVIDAPSRLDAMTPQMVELTARLDPAQQRLAALRTQFAETALASVAHNVDETRQRLAFADSNITNARALVARPASSQSGLVDAVRAAESALGQARTLLDAIDSAATDIDRAAADLPATIADLQAGIDEAGGQLSQGSVPHGPALASARDAAVAAVAAAKADGTADPLGAFTRLTEADATLDRLLATIGEERATAERLSRAFDQALFTAQSRIRGVSDFIDTRRGSIGPEARTRLAEANRQVAAAQAKQSTDLTEAIALANAAANLAAQAQSQANADAAAAQRSFAGQSGGDPGAMLGGIIIGNILSGALRGGIGGSVGGGWSSTTFGGSDGGGFRGGGGRF